MFVFVSGDLALDFAGTLKWRRSAPEELLATPADAARWAVEAGVLSAAPPVSAVDFEALLALREQVYRLAAATAEGRSWPARDLRALNAAAAGPLPVRSLTVGGIRRTGGAAELGAAVAVAAVELLGTAGAAGIVRECAFSECTRLFVDRSRAGNRAWCGMEECGNRVKAAAYRARRAGRGAGAAAGASAGVSAGVSAGAPAGVSDGASAGVSDGASAGQEAG